MEHISCDVLIVGSGAAGLRASISAKAAGLGLGDCGMSPGKGQGHGRPLHGRHGSRRTQAPGGFGIRVEGTSLQIVHDMLAAYGSGDMDESGGMPCRGDPGWTRQVHFIM